MYGAQETDEEIERRLMAQIAARGAANTEDDAGFDATIASLAGPEADEPEPAANAPLDLGRLATADETFGGSAPTAAPQRLDRVAAEDVAAAGPTRHRPEAGGAGSARGAAAPVADANVDQREAAYRRQLASLDQQQNRQRRVRGFFGSLLSPLTGRDTAADLIGQHAGEFDQRRESIRGELSQMLERRDAERRERNAEILRGIEGRRRGETEDRRADLERQRVEETRRYHDALLEDSDARIGQGATRTENDTLRAELAAARAGRRGGATAPGPVAPHGRGGPREVLHLPGDPRESGLPPEAQADRDAQVREYLEQRRQTDPEYYRAIRARLGSGASDYAVAQEIASNGETWGRTTGRRGADRSRNIRLLTSGASQDPHAATMDSHLAVAQARASAQREQRAVPFEEQGEFADEAAAALERIVAQTGDMGARVIRGDNIAASAAAAMAGADVETDRAVFRDFLSNLLHERGGASLTLQEKVIIQEALASGSIMTSSEATIRTLRNIAARARRRAQSERHTGGVSAPAAPSPSGGTPSWRAIGRAENGDIIYQNTATGERRRRRAR